MQTGFAFTKLADRLTSIAELAADDLDLLARMPCTISHLASHENVLRRVQAPSHCCLLLRGYLCWRDGPVGQITSIHVPGDVPDLHTIASPTLEPALSALGPVVVAFVPHSFFREISSLSPNLGRALALLNATDLARLRNWSVNIGSRDSLARVAHLICEIAFRLRAVGLANDFRFPSPFVQSDLAAACAISAVHVNRIIQELRRRNVLHWQSKTITITDWQAFAYLADFEPNYLGLRDPSSASRHQPIRPAPAAEAAELATSQ